MRCLALDIGGTKIAAAIVKNGEVEQRQQIHTPKFLGLCGGGFNRYYK